MGFLARLTGTETAPAPKASNDSNCESSRYRGVQLTTITDECCHAVRELDGQRFLSNDVPMLPLNDCDVDSCPCTYRLYDDRRTDVRRASDLGFDIAAQLSDENNRNVDVPGRRIDD